MTMTNQWRHKFHFILTLARLGDVANVRVITALQNGLIKQIMAIIDHIKLAYEVYPILTNFMLNSIAILSVTASLFDYTEIK